MYSLPHGLRQDLLGIIRDLTEDPYPIDSKALDRELTGRHVIRYAGWRVLYRVNEQDKAVKIFDVRTRDSDTYLNVP
ncbi:MAG: hypothetical protein HC802_06645 [Caldilineaceae bacterium]|nr:hypothetical protein [Caldilineaceae bacterium]